MGNNHPILGFPNKKAAILALSAEGRPNDYIAQRTKSTADTVATVLRKARRDAGEGRNKGQRGPGPAPDNRGIWTPEKLEKAHRLFGKTMLYIAEALQVPADELVAYGLKGVIPPMGRAQRVAQLLEDHARQAEGDGDGNVDAAGADECAAGSVGGAGDDDAAAAALGHDDSGVGLEPAKPGALHREARSDHSGGGGSAADAAPAAEGRAGGDAAAGAAEAPAAAVAAEDPAVVPEAVPAPVAAGGPSTALVDEAPPPMAPGAPAAPLIADTEIAGEVHLRSWDGQRLHVNGRVLTRIPRFYWRGSRAAAEAMRAKAPAAWGALSMEAAR